MSGRSREITSTAEAKALAQQIDALLELDRAEALVPQGLDGLARELLEKSKFAVLDLAQNRDIFRDNFDAELDVSADLQKSRDEWRDRAIHAKNAIAYKKHFGDFPDDDPPGSTAAEREACVQILREVYCREADTGAQSALATAIELIEARANGNKFPRVRWRKPDAEPCGECHLKAGETCDICGARSRASTPAAIDGLAPGGRDGTEG